MAVSQVNILYIFEWDFTRCEELGVEISLWHQTVAT